MFELLKFFCVLEIISVVTFFLLTVAQMCHASVATGSDYVILDIMAAEWKMEQEGVTRCSCSVSIQGGDEFGFAQATTISPSQTCGTRVGITTNFQPDTTYGLECKSSRTQISGDSATVAFSKEPVAPENGYNYDYCLSIYICKYLMDIIFY